MNVSEKIMRAKADYDSVLDKGYQDGRVYGYGLGKTDGIEEGKSLGEREWQEKYQKEGRNNKAGYYICAYAGWGWTNETFNPAWDIVPSNASNMFNYSHITGNISKLCQEKGVRLDFSKCAGFQSTFVNSAITGVDTVDTRSCTDLSTIFYAAGSMVEINDLILKDDGSQTFGRQSFLNCKNLVTLKITGVIAGSGIDLSSSTLLSAESLRYILAALSKDPALASGKKIIFPTTAEEKTAADEELSNSLAAAIAAGWNISYA